MLSKLKAELMKKAQNLTVKPFTFKINPITSPNSITTLGCELELSKNDGEAWIEHAASIISAQTLEIMVYRDIVAQIKPSSTIMPLSKPDINTISQFFVLFLSSVQRSLADFQKISGSTSKNLYLLVNPIDCSYLEEIIDYIGNEHSGLTAVVSKSSVQALCNRRKGTMSSADLTMLESLAENTEINVFISPVIPKGSLIFTLKDPSGTPVKCFLC